MNREERIMHSYYAENKEKFKKGMQKLFLIGRRCFHRIILISEKIA